MKTSRLAQSVTSHSLIIVREFDLMQGISEPYPGSVKHMRAAKIGRRHEPRGDLVAEVEITSMVGGLVKSPKADFS
jgi:hypothetical protein